jgi:hypothetical protein
MDIRYIMTDDPSDSSLSPGERLHRNTHRYLAERIRQGLLSLPCNPETPEARADFEAAVTAVATAHNPLGYAELAYAANAAVNQAHESARQAELAEWRGDPVQTARLLAQAARHGRESRGALNALMKLQRQRERQTNDERSMADAAGRASSHGLTQAFESMPPPTPPPPARPAAAAEPRTARRAAATPDPLEKTDAYAAMRKVFGVPLIMRPPAPLPPSLLHLADAPAPDPALFQGPHAAPGYAPWEPGCETPMWWTLHDDNLLEEQKLLWRVWDKADRYCILMPQRAQVIRQHRGLPPDWKFEVPDDDVMFVLMHDNSSNFTWADKWRPHVPKNTASPAPAQSSA